MGLARKNNPDKGGIRWQLTAHAAPQVAAWVPPGPTACSFSGWTANEKPAIQVRAWFRGICSSEETTCDMRSVDK
jgi:hypothetical protein